MSAKYKKSEIFQLFWKSQRWISS